MRYLLVSCFLSISSMLYAQSGHVRPKIIAGVMASQVDGDYLGGYNKAGAILGMAMELPLSKKLGIQPEIMYCQKGAHSTENSPYFLVNRLSYIDIAGTLNIYLKPRLALQPGIYYGVLFRAMADNGYGFVDASAIYKKNDLGYLASVEYRFSDRTAVHLRFAYSLLSIHKQFGQYNNSLSFTLRFLLGNSD